MAPKVLWYRVMNPHAASCPAVTPGHGNVAAGLVDKDQPSVLVRGKVRAVELACQ